MRLNRIKPDDQNTWHHCHNRVSGTSLDRPFGPAEKEQFIRILTRVSRLCCIEVVAFQVMSTHYHVLLRTPVRLPSEAETCERYAAYYNGRRRLEPGTEAYRRWQRRMRDVSWFLRLIQQIFAVWYNRTRPVPRHGSLWADRFKNTVLESGEALWRCWAYVENNPVRAGIVTDAADYRFGSLGRWMQRGRHPFEEHLARTLLPELGPMLGITTLQDLREALRGALADDAESTATQDAPGFVLTARRRVRFWVDGVAIGSELFVRGIVGRMCQKEAVARHRLAMARAPTSADAIYAWRGCRVGVD